jgi:hypothetical protein
MSSTTTDPRLVVDGPGPRAALRLVRAAAEAQRTGVPAVVVIRIAEGDRLGRSTGLLRFARALGLRTILEAGTGALEHLVLRRPELVQPTLRAVDAVVVPGRRTMALLHDLTGGRLHIELAEPDTMQRLQRTLAAA